MSHTAGTLGEMPGKIVRKNKQMYKKVYTICFRKIHRNIT